MRNVDRAVYGILALVIGAACAGGDETAEGTMMTTESGLEYEVLHAGEGPTATIDDRVVINYRGTLTDGTQFDSSYDRGEPATFPVNGVIDGFGEALQLMSVGSHFRVTIPSELAYGEAGAGTTIGPNETLIFEIELLDILEG